MSIQFLDERLPARFWSKCMPEPNSGCWLWVGARTIQEYGRVAVGDGSGATVMAHRFSYRHLVGPFDEELDIDHRCFNGLCVNPAHLEPVTHRINMLRGSTMPGRAVAHIATTGTCKHGHDYSVHGRVKRNGARWCIACNRIRNREYQAARSSR